MTPATNAVQIGKRFTDWSQTCVSLSTTSEFLSLWPSTWWNLAKWNCILRATLTEDNLCREELSITVCIVANKRITLRKILDTVSLNSDNNDTNIHGTLTLDEVEDYENNQQDALYRLIYYSKSALHVSGDVFAHHQEYLTIYRIWQCSQFQLIRDTSRQQLRWTPPDTVNTVKCSWWWAKTSLETFRVDLE